MPVHPCLQQSRCEISSENTRTYNQSQMVYLHQNGLNKKARNQNSTRICKQSSEHSSLELRTHSSRLNL